MPESSSEPSSVDLLSKAVGGDQVAMDALLRRHLPGLRAFVRLRMGARVRAREESTDLVQSVCREILQHSDRFAHGGEAGFRHWLYRTAIRKIADRHDYYTSARRDEARECAGGDGDLAGLYATLWTPSRVAAAREQIARLEAAFDQLSDAQREVVLGARMLGLSHTELANRMGRSEGAVRTLLCRSLARLTEILADGDEPAPPGGTATR